MEFGINRGGIECDLKTDWGRRGGGRSLGSTWICPERAAANRFEPPHPGPSNRSPLLRRRRLRLQPMTTTPSSPAPILAANLVTLCQVHFPKSIPTQLGNSMLLHELMSYFHLLIYYYTPEYNMTEHEYVNSII